MKKAIAYVEKHFPNNPGSTENFIYPITRKEALASFRDFLAHRLKNFGKYQDAIVPEENYLYHSLLSAPLNIDLLQPKELVEKTISYAEKHAIPINSIEGFIRQILGWREFVRGVYLSSGEEQRKENFWNHSRKIPKSFWNASTGVTPIDTTIKKAIETAYAHHIERLMILSNFMQLCEFAPDDVYKWFMEFFIDSYDWVMVPNVYGMGQYADGGQMVTKPYISSSNYLKKMGRFEKGAWQELWDALYWNFLDKHKKKLSKIPRMKLILHQLKQKDPIQLKEQKSLVRAFFKDL